MNYETNLSPQRHSAVYPQPRADSSLRCNRVHCGRGAMFYLGSAFFSLLLAAFFSPPWGEFRLSVDSGWPFLWLLG
jgi:hypothetical protein